MTDLLAALRVAFATMAVCVAGYAGVILLFAQAVAPGAANGSLVVGADGTVIGSRLVAQGFSSPGYVWPRPSAVAYAADGAGGSNLSPLNPALRERAEAIVAAHGGAGPIPADLVTASGAGLDPHVSLEGALFQADRVAAARGVPVAEVTALIERLAAAPGGPFAPGRIVNVLELNLALDEALAPPAPSS